MQPAHQYVTGNPLQNARGFTLIEVLMVVAIIGIFVSVTVLNLGDGGLSRKVEDEALRMSALLKLAQEEAILNAKDLALELTSDGYQFVLLSDEEEWQPITNDDVLRKRKLSAGIELGLTINSLNIDLAKKNISDDGKVGSANEIPPRIYIFSSGEMEPFIMTFRSEYLQGQYELEGFANGELKLKKPEI